ncbi:MAG: hypothetical protein Q8R34_00095 [bacterium]|nr:hypothetical protein [bacterium]
MYETYGTVAASDVVRTSLLSLYGSVAQFLPRLIAAIIVFLVGWLVAILIAKLVYHIVRVIQIDRALEGVGFKKVWERSGFKLNTPLFFGELVKWFFIVVFLLSAANILGLTEVSQFLNTVVLYIPNVIVAAIILLIGLMLAKFLEGLVMASVKAANLISANLLGAIAKWAVVVFSLLVALNQLGIAQDIIKIVITGVVAAASIALGLSLGLGGQKHAEEFIAAMKKRIKD